MALQAGPLFGRVTGPIDLRDFLGRAGIVLRPPTDTRPDGQPGGERFVIKVNWYAPLPGYYTSARTLDLLLSALPGEKLVVEGYSHARNDGSRRLFASQVDRHRDWIRAQDRWFLQHTGLGEVLDRHGARYLSVTEELWSGRTIPAQEVRAAVRARFGAAGGLDAGDPLRHPEFYACIPAALLEWRDATFLNFAKLKLPKTGDGPWSPPLKNIFGLVPDPDRHRYHRDLPRSIIDINLVYRSLFTVVDLAEALHEMLWYHPAGRHRVAWGSYDVLEGRGLVACDANPVELDVACAELFGIDLRHRDLVRAAAPVFGRWDDEAIARATRDGEGTP